MYAGEIIERGPAEEVTQHPAHPYTQLLVASAPDPDNLGGVLRARRPPAARIREHAGQRGHRVPVQSAVPAGRSTAAATEMPRLQPISAMRAAACWRLDVAAPELVVTRADGEGA